MGEIDELTKSMEQETKAIKAELFRFCWFMRGGLSVTESYDLSIEDKEIISKLIEDNIETTKETKLPFF
jgi:hypothetical protein